MLTRVHRSKNPHDWQKACRTVRGLPEAKDFIVDIWGHQKNLSFGIHNHPDYCDIVYTLDGTLTNWVNGVEYHCHAGDLILIRSHDFHDTYARQVNFSNIVFSDVEIERLIQDSRNLQSKKAFKILLQSPEPPIANLPESQRERFVEKFHSLVPLQDTPQGYLAMRVFVSDIIRTYLLPPLSLLPIPSEAPDWLASCLSEIYNAPQKNWTLDDLLRLSHRSQEHVCRAFKHHLGTTPTQFLNDRRLDRAERFLLSTRQSITDICYLVGFENLSYFHRLFRQRHKATPLQYRKQHAMNAG